MRKIVAIVLALALAWLFNEVYRMDIADAATERECIHVYMGGGMYECR